MATAPKTSVTASRQWSPSRASAFTLVELLVVIGIIATLVAILLPALAAARASARATQCQSNLRQLVIAFNLYADDYQGVMPPNSATGTLGTTWWFGFTDQGYPVTDRNLDTSQGLVTSYLGTVTSQLQCPEFPYDAGNYLGKFDVPAASYGLNIYLSEYPYVKRYHKRTQVTSPATTVILADGVHVDGLPPGYFNEADYLGMDLVGNTPSLGPYGGFVHWRHHNGMAYCAYLDCHVDAVTAKQGYVVSQSLGGSAAGDLTTGNIGPYTPYGQIP